MIAVDVVAVTMLAMSVGGGTKKSSGAVTGGSKIDAAVEGKREYLLRGLMSLASAMWMRLRLR